MAKPARDEWLYDRLKMDFEELTKDLKFSGQGKSEDEVYRKMKLHVANECRAALDKQDKLRKAKWIGIAVSVLMVLCGGFMDLAYEAFDVYVVILLVVIGLSVGLHKWARSYDAKYQACMDFDEDFFDGEIFYKLKNGIEI